MDTYFRAKYDKECIEEERRAQDAAARKEAAKLTPEQKEKVMAMFERMQRETDEVDAKADDDAQKAAEQDATSKADAYAPTPDNANTANGKNANKSDNTDADRNAATDDTDTNTTSPNTPATRGPTAVANALACHPEVDLDAALENHHATACVPKENLTYEQIYTAIIAGANFQKRQSITQRRMRQENPDAPEVAIPPKSRSP